MSTKKETPSYTELADIVCALVEMSIANVDAVPHRFVSCFTFSAGEAPEQWHRAVNAREALIASRQAKRRIRRGPDGIRSMR